MPRTTNTKRGGPKTMTRMTESFKIGASRPVISSERADGFVMETGFIVTKSGVVGVWAYQDDASASTTYTFGDRGREHRMSEPTRRSRKGTAIVAGRFARSVVRGDL
jgi:hypothetical protein